MALTCSWMVMCTAYGRDAKRRQALMLLLRAQIRHIQCMYIAPAEHFDDCCLTCLVPEQMLAGMLQVFVPYSNASTTNETAKYLDSHLVHTGQFFSTDAMHTYVRPRSARPSSA